MLCRHEGDGALAEGGAEEGVVVDGLAANSGARLPHLAASMMRTQLLAQELNLQS
jgi:hypothetical protein